MVLDDGSPSPAQAWVGMSWGRGETEACVTICPSPTVKPAQRVSSADVFSDSDITMPRQAITQSRQEPGCQTQEASPHTALETPSPPASSPGCPGCTGDSGLGE